MADDGAPNGFTEGGSSCSSRGAAARGLDYAAGRGPTDRAARDNQCTGVRIGCARQRIMVSQAEVNSVKWWSLHLQAICELLVIAVVDCGNRLPSAIAMGLFATGVATSVLLIAAHD